MILLCAVYLAACNDDPQSASPPAYPSRQEQTTAADKANQKNRLLQQQFEAEHTLRVQAETQLGYQTEAKTWWQTAATLFAVSAVVLLGVGATLGSAARYESQKS